MTSTKEKISAYAEEKAEVEVLKGQLAKHEDLGKRLRGLQARLQGDGRSVSDSIGPIQDNTREHQTVTKNIDKLIHHIDKMLVSGQDKAHEENIIRLGPAKAGLDEYLSCMRRIDRSLEQSTFSRMKVQQQTSGDYKALLQDGIVALEQYFGLLISERSQTVEPQSWLLPGKNRECPSLSADKCTQLRAIQSCLSTATARKLSNSVPIYSDIRSHYLFSSLQSASMSTRTTSKRKHGEDSYQPGDSAIEHYANAIRGMFKAEYQNIQSIFARDEVAQVFDKTYKKAFSELTKTLRDLNTQIRADLSCYFLLAHETIEKISQLDQDLSHDTGNMKLPFSEALRPITETARYASSELIEDQKRRIGSMQSLPPDGGSLPFTTETMMRLQRMPAFPRSIYVVLGGPMSDGGWTSNPLVRDVGVDSNTLLSVYVMETLEAHFFMLDARSKTVHKKPVTGVLLYNTHSLVDRMIRSSDLAGVTAKYRDFTPKMDAWKKKALNTYMDLWKECSSALLDVVYTSRPNNRPASAASLPSADIVKNLSTKDKDAIKEKYKQFNGSFEESVKRHKEMMPAMEREVRSALAREVTNLVEPLYSRFFDKYEALDRGRGKYVRYDKGSISAILAGLG